MSSEPDSKKSVSSIVRHKPRSRSTPRHPNNDKPRKKRHLSAANSLVSIPNTIKLSMLNSGLLPTKAIADQNSTSMDYQEEVRNDDELLIKSVRTYANIFDKRSNLFKDKIARAKAWGAIAYALRKKPEECEQRWVVLRHRYVTEKRKMREDLSIKKSLWPLYNSMGFLDIFITPRKSSWNSKKAIYEDSASMSPQLMAPTIISVEGEASRDAHLRVEEIEIKNEEIEYEIVDSPSTPTTTEPASDGFDGLQNFSKPKTREGDLTLSVATAIGELRECLQRTQTERYETCDSDFSFGKTVALHLKDIKNGKRKRRVKLQIMKILLGEDSDDENKQ